jgi:hypothetical protein
LPIPDWVARYDAEGGADYKKKGARENGDPQPPAIFHRLDRVLQRLDAGHARFLFGTDTPGTPSYANAPGLNEFFEMRPKTLVHSANARKRPRHRAGEPDRQHRVRQVANLLLLRANPLLNVDAYNSIDTVFLHGRPIARGTLSASVKRSQ